MIAHLKRRARSAGLLDRIDARVVPSTSMHLDDLTESIDFGFAFAVVHEMPAAAPFFAEVPEPPQASEVVPTVSVQAL